MGPSNIFDFLNVRPFSPGHPLESNMCKYVIDKANNILNVRPFSPKGFFTFLVGVAHGVLLDF